MQQAGYHHPNMLAKQLFADMTEQNAQLMAMMQSVQTSEEEISEPAANDLRTMQSKAPGHQDNATFENRMGGSNAFRP